MFLGFKGRLELDSLLPQDLDHISVRAIIEVHISSAMLILHSFITYHAHLDCILSGVLLFVYTFKNSSHGAAMYTFKNSSHGAAMYTFKNSSHGAAMYTFKNSFHGAAMRLMRITCYNKKRVVI
ncbi:hypothetical protein ACJX0J_023716 [Zea mays]